MFITIAVNLVISQQFYEEIHVHLMYFVANLGCSHL